MSGKFLALADSVSEALAGFAAAELAEPADVEESVKGAALWLQDVGYVLLRLEARLNETGIHPDVAERIGDAGRSASANAAFAEDLVHFSLAGRYP